MPCIHFKFKISLDYDSITFDGLHISLKDLKRRIMSRKKLRDTDADLQIINAVTKKAYSNDEEMIPKNSSVIVARIPATNAAPRKGPKTLNHPNAYKEDPKPVRKPIVEVPVSKAPDLLETGNLVDANASEEDKIKAMMRQSTLDFDPANYISKKAPMGTPSPTYICRKCGNSGHFIQNCPVEPGKKLAKRPTGIPLSFLTVVNDPNAKGALLIGPGQYGVPTIDMNAYKEKKKERSPFLPEEKLPEPKKEEVPAELLCPLCKNLLTDAVVIQCCGSSFCDECIRYYLLESEDHVCPQCHKSEQSPDRLIAIKSLRSAVTNYRNETGYTKVTKARLNAQRERREAVKAVASAAAQKMEARQETVKLTNSSDAPITPQAIPTYGMTAGQHYNFYSSVPGGPPTPCKDEKDILLSEMQTQSSVSSTPPMVPSTSAPSHPVQSAAGTSQIPPTSQHMAPRPPVIPANFPTVPIQTVGVPYRPPLSILNPAIPPPGFVGPPPTGPFGPGPGPRFAPAPPVIPAFQAAVPTSMPLSKEEFYRRQKKMQEPIKNKKTDPLDVFARQIMDYKKKPKSASRSRSKSRSGSPRQSHSPRRSRKRSRSRSLNRSRSPFGKRPYRSRSRSPRPRSFSRSPPRFRSRSRTPPPRWRSRSRRLDRYDKCTPPSYGCRRSRSPPPKGRPVGRGPPPPPYPYPHDPHNRCDRHAYDKFYHEFYARYGLPPPPPPNYAIYDAPPYPLRKSRSPKDRRPYKDRPAPRPKAGRQTQQNG